MDAFLDLSEGQYSERVAEVLPFYLKLESDDSLESSTALDSIKLLADKGNSFACYVCACFYVFGRKPRFYYLHKKYEPGIVHKEALAPINEPLGLSYFTRLLKLQEGVVEIYHLEGIYDLYKILEGRAAFFTTNDIQCRTLSESLLKPLFSSVDKLRNLMVKMSHYEVYIDHAESMLAEFQRTNDQASLTEALKYIEDILDEDLALNFTLYEINRAKYLLGCLYLYGNDYLDADEDKGVDLLNAARTDEAMCELIKFYKSKGDGHQQQIETCINLIDDEALRSIKFSECSIDPPKPISLRSSLDRLKSAKTKVKHKSNNLSFEFEQPLDSTNVVQRASEITSKIEDSKVLENAAEIASTFETIELADFNLSEEAPPFINVDDPIEEDRDKDLSVFESEEEYEDFPE